MNRDAMAAFVPVQGQPCLRRAGTSPFTDVAPTDQFYTEMAWLRSTGVSTGWPDGSYRPVTPVMRDAMAAFLYRLNGI